MTFLAPWKISDIKNHLLRPATTNNFEVQIPFNAILNSKLRNLLTDKVLNEAGVFLNTNDQWKLRLLCSEVSLPGSTLGTTEINNDRTGVTEKHVNRRIYDTQGIDFTFYVNADNYIPIRLFETWMDYAVGVETAAQREDTKNPNYFYRMKYPDEYTGVREQHVHRRLYDDQGIEFTFYVNADNYIPIRLFETWMDYAVGVETAAQREDTKNKNYFYRMKYPDEYIADQGLKIIKFEKDFNTNERVMGGILEYEFIRAFPVSISSMPVTYASAELLEVRVTFSYVRYVMNKGWMQTSNKDPLRLYTNLAKEVLSGDLRGAWEVLTSGGVPAQVANAAGNAVRSLVTFAFGEEGADNLRGGARWASSTLSWLGSFGR